MNKSQISKLNKLNDLRVKKQEKQLKHSKYLYLESCEKVETRSCQINHLKKEKKGLLKYSKLETTLNSPTKREFVHIKRYWLNYDLEMHEYYLDQEIDERNTKHSQYERDKKIWYLQMLKKQKLSILHNNVCIEENAILDNSEDDINQENSIIGNYR
ncbi:hypothetical protein A3194_14340 [Candidatus Thiodiazotropha endoloripes]|uniref:hypothetical protein n=1 Tax=Candidatus Thiodiazotropha endoloripes TaxID=1818881 RepID=UPI00083D2380|nr:hypothetical protein [Candidatus Thiodiazotropha endoloripes]MCG7901287.1 hypothetical protein [Candidatus Thiodiazotropha weberae]ODB84935.1 hypothetical protein A3194_14340 [Candidatus Thiodiazotropha endoloripes]